MRIALYGATGRAGSRILSELQQRNHHVLAIARDPQPRSSSDTLNWKIDNLSDAEHSGEIIRGTDAVVSAYAPPPDNPEELVAVCQRLAKAVELAAVPRLLVVGGAGSLEVAPGVTLLQSGYLPPEWTAIATAHGNALEALKQTSIDWTYLAPAAFFDPGERRGHYRVSLDTLITDEKGESRISMEDYALALVDELERPQHHRTRFAVGW